MAPVLSLSPASGYKPGDKLTLTVTDATRGKAAVAEVDQELDVTNPESGAVGHESIVFGAVPAVPAKPFTVVDSSGRVWTQVSDDGTKAVFTATA